jgi:hypothetical protein
LSEIGQKKGVAVAPYLQLKFKETSQNLNFQKELEPIKQKVLPYFYKESPVRKL